MKLGTDYKDRSHITEMSSKIELPIVKIGIGIHYPVTPALRDGLVELFCSSPELEVEVRVSKRS